MSVDASELLLAGVPLVGWDLSGLTFTGQELKDATFIRCKLEGAIFAYDKIQVLNLVECETQALHINAAEILSLRIVKCNATGLRADLKDLDNSFFQESDLSGAHITADRISGSQFCSCVTHAMTLNAIELQRCAFIDTQIPPTSGSKLNRCMFRGGELRASSVTGCHFQNCVVATDRVIGDWSNTEFHQCIFMEALVGPARFDTIDLSGTSFAKSNFNDVEFSGCRMEHTSFVQSELTHVAIKDCEANVALFANARLHDCSISETNLSGSIFNHAFVEVTKISRSNMSFAQFQHAVLNDCDLFENTTDFLNLEGAEFKRVLGLGLSPPPVSPHEANFLEMEAMF